MLDEGMEACDLRKEIKQMVGNRSTREIVDEPAELGVPLHPTEKTDEIEIGQVVRKDSADDYIERRFGREGENIGGDPTYPARRRKFCSNGNSVGVNVDSNEVDSEIASCSPLLDAAQGIAVAASDVQDAQRLRDLLRVESVEPSEERWPRAEPLVETRDVVKAGAELITRTRLIHQLSQLCAAAEVWRRRQWR